VADRRRHGVAAQQPEPSGPRRACFGVARRQGTTGYHRNRALVRRCRCPLLPMHRIMFAGTGTSPSGSGIPAPMAPRPSGDRFADASCPGIRWSGTGSAMTGRTHPEGDRPSVRGRRGPGRFPIMWVGGDPGTGGLRVPTGLPACRRRPDSAEQRGALTGVVRIPVEASEPCGKIPDTGGVSSAGGRCSGDRGMCRLAGRH